MGVIWFRDFLVAFRYMQKFGREQQSVFLLIVVPCFRGTLFLHPMPHPFGVDVLEDALMQDKIGKRIRTFREKQDLTLESMAERTGLERAFLAAVEEEGIYPSLGPLLKIARVLGVRLGTFLDDQVSRDPLIVRLDERHEEMTMHGGNHIAAFRYFPLGQGKSDRHMEPFFIEILPESSKDKSLSSHEGEEFILVHSGELSVTYGKEEKILTPGDSIYFNSIVPHNVSAAGSGKCEIYAVLYFPE